MNPLVRFLGIVLLMNIFGLTPY